MFHEVLRITLEKLIIVTYIVCTLVNTKQMMRFEWDEAKNTANIEKHGIDFEDAKDIFKHPILISEDTKHNYGESRWIGLGWIRSILGVVIYVERCGDVIRIISARKATKRERKYYEQSIEN